MSTKILLNMEKENIWSCEKAEKVGATARERKERRRRKKMDGQVINKINLHHKLDKYSLPEQYLLVGKKHKRQCILDGTCLEFV
jgi:hypothetical protein